MAVRYQNTRLFVAGALAAAVIGGTAYFAETTTSTSASAATDASASSTFITSTSTTSAPRQTVIRVKRSRGS